MNIRNLKLAFGMMALALFSSQAFAWKTVYDPSNFVQNYTTAVQAVKTEMNTAETMRQQIQATLDLCQAWDIL